jgi:plasmid stabilization system protein ParE
VRRVELDPAARAELERSVDRYERDHPGRGLRFGAAVERATRAAAATPSAGSPFPGVPERFGVRRRMVLGFPFCIAYRLLGDVIRVDAVVHERRPPGYWLRRVQRR